MTKKEIANKQILMYQIGRIQQKIFDMDDTAVQRIISALNSVDDRFKQFDDKRETCDNW